ncbi:MAG: glycosyltransferase [Candidatus Cloacimonetes bacterium]|nr:glycosyltransferase [Candidatus Cloacimonadota bacterium]
MSLYESNITLIKKHPAQFHINTFAKQYLFKYIYEKTNEDNYSLKIVFQSQSEQSYQIHSAYTPEKEASLICDRFFSENQNILITGFGMGYHIEALSKKYPDKTLIIIENDMDLFLSSLSYIDLRKFVNFYFIIAYPDYMVMDIVSQILIDKSNTREFDIYELKPYLRIHQSYYQFIMKHLKNEKIYDLSPQWFYPKFKNATTPVKILFIDSSYVLTKECLFAIQETGHQVHYIHIDDKQTDYEVFVRKLMLDINQFKPDFILTINHLGFDKEGRLTDLLSEMHIPYASWFVDSPNVILSCFKQNISDYCSIFVWDRDYIDDLIKTGYPYVDYLPLATSSDIFYPKSLSKIYDVSFVGSSMVYATHKNMKSFIHRPDLLHILEDVSNEFIRLKTRHVEHAVKKLTSGHTEIFFEDNDQKDDFYAAVLWRSTQKYRLSGLLELETFSPVISGDENWQRLLPFSFRKLPERWYYEDLADFYNQSKINFNMTSLQMKNAVNQRVFDVPACGGFILTDYKEQLNEIYDLSNDIAYFKEIGEIKELVKYYLANLNVCEKMASNARNKVLKAHTYAHRINEMINIMKKRYQ